MMYQTELGIHGSCPMAVGDTWMIGGDVGIVVAFDSMRVCYTSRGALHLHSLRLIQWPLVVGGVVMDHTAWSYTWEDGTVCRVAVADYCIEHCMPYSKCSCTAGSGTMPLGMFTLDRGGVFEGGVTLEAGVYYNTGESVWEMSKV